MVPSPESTLELVASHLLEDVQHPEGVSAEVTLAPGSRIQIHIPSAESVNDLSAISPAEGTPKPCSPCSPTSSQAPSPISEVGFQQRLQVLLAMEEGTAILARKIFSRFNGQTDRLPSVLELLEHNWGFPSRLFPLLWTHLRRSVFRSRGQYVSVSIGKEEAPAHVQEQEWVEAFGHWLQAVQGRCGQAKLSRKDLVRRRFHDSYTDVNDTYFQGPLIGEGCYGKVHAMFHKALGVERAVKIICNAQLSMERASAEAEIKVLKLLDHPHIVRIYETIEAEDSIQIVMDYAEGGDLAGVIERAQKSCQLLAEGWCRDVAQQISSALEYMHSKGVIHCDLKPANAMLLKPAGPHVLVGDCSAGYAAPHIVLVDFGISEMFNERNEGGQLKVRGTPLYLSPEAFDGNVSEKSDMWALGVIVFELLTSRRPFEAESPVLLLVVVSTREPAIDVLPALSREVVRGLLAKDPITRLTAKECRATEWFTSAPSAVADEPASEQSPLQGIGHTNYFQRAAMFCVAAGLSMKDMHKLFEVFKQIDKDGSGNLNLQEFTAGLQQFGIQEDPAALMSILDVDQNGSISYTEFVAGTLAGKESESLPEQMLREAFGLFDLDSDGHISEQELRVMLSGHGPMVEVLPDGSTVEKIMQKVGNGAGAISFKAFAAYIIKAAQEPKSRRGSRCSSIDESPVRAPSKHASSVHDNTPSSSGQGEAQHVLSNMMHDLDSIASKTDWKTPVSRTSALLSSLLEEGSTVAPGDVLPPLHKWVSEMCKEDDRDSAAISCILNFPAERPDPRTVAESLPAICRHFWAGIYLARLLAEEHPARAPSQLCSAVTDAVQSHVNRDRRQLQIKAERHERRLVRNQIKAGHRKRGDSSQTEAGLRKRGNSSEREADVRPMRFGRKRSTQLKTLAVATGEEDMPKSARGSALGSATPMERQLSAQASEPLLPGLLPAKVAFGRGGRSGQLMKQSRSEVVLVNSKDNVYPDSCVMVPKMASPTLTAAGYAMSRAIEKGNFPRKGYAREDFSQREQQRPSGFWRP